MLVSRKEEEGDGPALEVKGNFSWGLTDKKEEEKDKDKDSEKEEEKEDKLIESKDSKKKGLEKFVQLRDIDLKISKGEFVCVVGDVGSGKSSLLHAIIGDMIYIP